MLVAALTPRVRTIVICEEVVASLFEDVVFTLEGVRFNLAAESFPCRRALTVFLLLSSARIGRYAGKVLVVNEQNDKAIRFAKFDAAFRDSNEFLALHVDLGDCVFPNEGRYNFEIYFAVQGGSEALKGEHPFAVFSSEA